MQLLPSATLILLLVLIGIQGENIITSNCGRRLVNHNPLITYGFETAHWPWHAAVYHQGYKRLPEYKCGGTLINANSVLTAAHCISQNNEPIAPSKVLVSLGRLNLDVNESSAQSFEVAKIIQHPRYNSIDLVDDIAVLRLSTDAFFNNYIQPVCLWNANKIKISEVIGRVGTVVGWGVTETGAASNVLLQASMPVVSSLICLKTNRPFFGSFLTETNFCAGFQNGTRACNGDSGGSMTFEENGIYYIRGIVSLGAVIEDAVTGRLSCDPTQFAIFTDVAQYLPWIDEVTKECGIKVECSTNYISCSANNRTRGKYLGCYQDRDEHRGLRGFAVNSKSMTVEKCIEMCRSGSYVYAGLQAGSWCLCDNTKQYPIVNNQLSEKRCNAYCSGNASQYCGGVLVNAVYETGVEQFLIDEEGRQLTDSYIEPSSHAYFYLYDDGQSEN